MNSHERHELQCILCIYRVNCHDKLEDAEFQDYFLENAYDTSKDVLSEREYTEIHGHFPRIIL